MNTPQMTPHAAYEGIKYWPNRTKIREQNTERCKTKPVSVNVSYFFGLLTAIVSHVRKSFKTMWSFLLKTQFVIFINSQVKTAPHNNGRTLIRAHSENSSFLHILQKAFKMHKAYRLWHTDTTCSSEPVLKLWLSNDLAFSEDLCEHDRIVTGKHISKTLYNFLKNCWIGCHFQQNSLKSPIPGAPGENGYSYTKGNLAGTIFL